MNEWQTTMIATAAETKEMKYFMVVRLYAREANREVQEVKDIMSRYAAKNRKTQLTIKLARHRYYDGDYYEE